LGYCDLTSEEWQRRTAMNSRIIFNNKYFESISPGDVAHITVFEVMSSLS